MGNSLKIEELSAISKKAVSDQPSAISKEPKRMLAFGIALNKTSGFFADG
jgi:hypothetical protein